jgi:hypothetical protein
MFDDLLAATPKSSPGAGEMLVALMLASALCPLSEPVRESLGLLTLDWCDDHYRALDRLKVWKVCDGIIKGLMEADAERRYRAAQGKSLSL